MNRILLLCLLSFSTIYSYCQTTSHDLNVLDIQLSRLCNQRAHYVFSEQREAVMGRFDSMMLKITSLSESFSYPFDSLERCIYITYSNDSAIKCYAYDNLDGGSAHTYTNIVSYFNQNDSFVSHEIPLDHASPMVGYSEIYRLRPYDMQLYLFMGFGTYGGGKHHISLQIFMLQDASLTECFDCYEDYLPLFIEHNRTQDFEIEFDEEQQLIHAKTYRLDNNIGFYTDEFDILSYSIIDGKLMQIR